MVRKNSHGDHDRPDIKPSEARKILSSLQEHVRVEGIKDSTIDGGTEWYWIHFNLPRSLKANAPEADWDTARTKKAHDRLAAFSVLSAFLHREDENGAIQLDRERLPTLGKEHIRFPMDNESAIKNQERNEWYLSAAIGRVLKDENQWEIDSIARLANTVYKKADIGDSGRLDRRTTDRSR